MKTVLVIGESFMLRDFLHKMLSDLGLSTEIAENAVKGISRARTVIPDLFIIDDISRRLSIKEVLKSKSQNPNTKNTPAIIITSSYEKDNILKLIQFRNVRVIQKPLQIDSLQSAICELLNMKNPVDTTPSIIDVHYNEGIIFIEIALGLNTDKIKLIEYKINELHHIYRFEEPHVLIMFSNIEFSGHDEEKLHKLFKTVISNGHTYIEKLHVLSISSIIKNFLLRHNELRHISISPSLTKALDAMYGKRGSDLLLKDQTELHNKLTGDTANTQAKSEIELRFKNEKIKGAIQPKIAIIDDDIVVQRQVSNLLHDSGYEAEFFDDGADFIATADISSFDMLLLDIMMPKMDGFAVLDYMKESKIKVPVVILSALDKKETVLKSMAYGVRSYIIKPISNELVLKKTKAITGRTF